MSKAEVFCRDRRLYDVRRGVVYLRRTYDLAQRQWRHYGVVPAVKTHVIRDIGVTAHLADVTNSSPVGGDDANKSADQTTTNGLTTGNYDITAASPTTGVGEEPDPVFCEEENSKTIPVLPEPSRPNPALRRNEKRFRYRTTMLERFTTSRPLISITEVSETSHTTAPVGASARASSDSSFLLSDLPPSKQNDSSLHAVKKGGRGRKMGPEPATNNLTGSGNVGLSRNVLLEGVLVKESGGGRNAIVQKVSQEVRPVQIHMEGQLDTSLASTDKSCPRRRTGPSTSTLDHHHQPEFTGSHLSNFASSGSFPMTSITTSKDVLYTFRESHGVAGDDDCSPFNTWGSRDWDVEDKLQDDLKPRSYTPKRYPLQSRVSGDGVGEGSGIGVRRRRRQLRTLTDFRSRNGTVRIIGPLLSISENRKRAAQPGGLQHRQHPRYQDDEDEEDFEVEGLVREQTYVMLKRIDRLLEPSKAYFTSDLASSEREICSLSTRTTPHLDQTLSDIDFEEGEDEGHESTKEEETENQEEKNETNVNLKESFTLPELNRRVRHSTGHQDVHSTGHQDVPYNRAAISLRNFYGLPSSIDSQGSFSNRKSLDDLRCHYPQQTLNRRQSEYQVQCEEFAQYQDIQFKGHSEPVRISVDLRYHKNLESLQKRHQQNSFFGGGSILPQDTDPIERQNVDDPQDYNSFRAQRRPCVAAKLQPLQLQHEYHQHPCSVLSQEQAQHSDNYRSHHNHNLHQHNQEHRGGKGSRRALVEAREIGWGQVGGKTLQQVITRLDQSGVDLHFKCQEWLKRSSTYFTTS